MNEIKEWFILLITGLGMDIAALKSGMMGGFIALAYERKRTARLAVLSIFSGAVMAGYLGPVAAKFFSLEGPTYAGACFLVGLLAMRLVPMIFAGAEDAVKSRLAGLKKTKNGKAD